MTRLRTIAVIGKGKKNEKSNKPNPVPFRRVL